MSIIVKLKPIIYFKGLYIFDNNFYKCLFCDRARSSNMFRQILFFSIISKKFTCCKGFNETSY